MVLIVLGVAVMLAATFVGMMSAQKAAGTRQTGRQITAQATRAGADFALQYLMTDYANARSANVPQRFGNLTHSGYSYTNASRGQINGYTGPYPANPTDRIGLGWYIDLQGAVGGGESREVISGRQTRVAKRANEWGFNNLYGYYQGLRSDASRPEKVDSMSLSLQAVPLQYADWKGGWYQDDGGYQTFGRYQPYMYYWGPHAASPRWWTLGYFDGDYQPLDWSSRDSAAFEVRFSVQPVPIDGNISINFGDRILGAKEGGRFRLGFRNPVIPADPLELSAGVVSGAIASGKTNFRNDQYDFDTGAKGSLSYNVGSTTGVSVGVAYPYQSYQLKIPGDTSWTGPTGIFPLAQQYGTAIGNMLGIWVVHDGGGSVSIRKDGPVIWTGTPATPPTLYNSYTCAASLVLTGGKAKATAGIGTLSKIMKIAMGQGYNGNFHGYSNTSNAGAGDPWHAPTLPAAFQVGTPASFRQFHANLGYGSSDEYTSVTISNDRILPLMSFAFTPFGQGLDRTRSPDRNRGSGDNADIDCPWYVNVMTLNRDPAQAIIAGMTPEYYANMDGKNGATGDSSGYPLNQSYMLPIPPDKPCPTRGASYAAKWNDGVARTGADGAEGGALPPLDATNTYVLTTGAKRPPRTEAEAGYHFADRGKTSSPADYNPFESNGPLVWRNPVRDELVGITGGVNYFAAPYTPDMSSWMVGPGRAYAALGMSGGNARVEQINSGEDNVAALVIGGSGDQALTYENSPQGAEANLNNNTDNVDERLSWQVDLIAAAYKALVDCHFDRQHGRKLRPGTTHGYEIIEDVETVFLGYLGIAVRYNGATSKASTVGASASDYTIYAGAPGTADAAWPLGRFNQLWALSQNANEIGADRSAGCTYNADNINTNGRPGQQGYRNYGVKVMPDANGLYPAGWPSGYQPTWAALSRVLEHRLNDFRMSLFGTPALDFNQDGFTDATTTNGSGVVSGNNQMRFSATGRLFLGRIHYYRVFTKAELWDRRNSTLVSDASLEQVVVLDPNGDGDLSDSHALFSRWHRAPFVDGRGGPTADGRTEAIP